MRFLRHRHWRCPHRPPTGAPPSCNSNWGQLDVPDFAGGGTDTTRTCGRSAIADVAADLTDYNVNENAWISSMILYKLGFFGIDWDHTPFLDNKASFQRGVNQAVRRTTTELADNLGRVRTTSSRRLQPNSNPIGIITPVEKAAAKP